MFHLSVFLCISPVFHLSQVRAELQSCVSRQQEALRCREVWLLGQIELLEQLKTETLQQQLHQLHWVTAYTGYTAYTAYTGYTGYTAYTGYDFTNIE